MNLTRKIIGFLTGRPPRLRFDDSTSIVVGDTVVCIADAWGSVVNGETGIETGGVLFTAAPSKGRVYRVDHIVKGRCGAIGLVLNEFPGSCWRANAFRKARFTSIECFKSLLNPSPEEVLAGTAGGNDYDVPAPSVAADERSSFLPGVSSRCLTARLLLSGGGEPSFLHRVTSPERLGSCKPGTAGARPLGGVRGGGGEPPVGDQQITTETFADAQKVFDGFSNVQ